MELTCNRARELFCYDPNTGALTWRVSLNARGPVGSLAGTAKLNGRRRVMVDGKRYQVHRVAWLIQNGSWPVAQLDHENLDPGDNRLVNLREATHSQNQANKRARRPIPKGVSLEMRTGRWRSRIKIGGKEVALGHFDTAEAAHQAYCVAAKQYFGVFARAA